MTAALGVVLNKDDNTQAFFGGGEVAMASKKEKGTDKKSHNNDITSLAISDDRSTCATG